MSPPLIPSPAGPPGPFPLPLSPGPAGLGGPLLHRHILDGDYFPGMMLHEEKERNEHRKAEGECRPEKPQMKKKEKHHEGKSYEDENHRCVIIHHSHSHSDTNIIIHRGLQPLRQDSAGMIPAHPEHGDIGRSRLIRDTTRVLICARSQ